MWEAASGWELLVLRSHQGGVDAVAFFTDGQRIVTGGNDQTVREWRAASPEQVTAWQAEEREAAERMATSAVTMH